jgi:hypothetical protein
MDANAAKLADLGSATTRKKALPPWVGPFPVERRLSVTVYAVTLPSGIRVSNHINLKHIKVGGELDNCPPPPVHVGTDGALWAVDKVVDSRVTKGSLLLVHRTGYDGPNDNTWEPIENLRHLPLLLEAHFGTGNIPNK